MKGRHGRVGSGQRLGSALVLLTLAAVCAWLGVRQGRFNPAVVNWQTHPLAAGGQVAGESKDNATAALLQNLPGLTPRGAAESYDPQTLSDKIDGKAELYLAADFKEMACRTFAPQALDGVHVTVSIYAMGSPQDAFAVFSNQRRPGAVDLPLGHHAYIAGNALFLTGGRHYVELVADKDDEQVAAMLQAVATALVKTLPAPEAAAGQEVDEQSLFPAQGLVAGSIRLIPADAFGMAGFSRIYTAEYQFSAAGHGPDATAFVAGRDSAAQAQADATAYRDFLLANGYTAAKSEGLPEGATLFTMAGSYELLMNRGKVLAGVHDAQSPQAAVDLGKALAGRLPAGRQPKEGAR